VAASRQAELAGRRCRIVTSTCSTKSQEAVLVVVNGLAKLATATRHNKVDGRVDANPDSRRDASIFMSQKSKKEEEVMSQETKSRKPVQTNGSQPSAAANGAVTGVRVAPVTKATQKKRNKVKRRNTAEAEGEETYWAAKRRIAKRGAKKAVKTVLGNAFVMSTAEWVKKGTKYLAEKVMEVGGYTIYLLTAGGVAVVGTCGAVIMGTVRGTVKVIGAITELVRSFIGDLWSLAKALGRFVSDVAVSSYKFVTAPFAKRALRVVA